MDTAHILQFVDKVLSAKTGKHLNDLQRGIIEGILNRQKYSDIADTYGCTAGHAKDVGYKLWEHPGFAKASNGQEIVEVSTTKF
ncbi:hypothetical protein [Microcoleus sp. D2_18a_D3]|uniref:hypothetical protein n=1 Tax=Microcoleus sp. D2_18a_D3 TaxID=3055330 RepID=UPI002FD0652F